MLQVVKQILDSLKTKEVYLNDGESFQNRTALSILDCSLVCYVTNQCVSFTYEKDKYCFLYNHAAGDYFSL